MTRRHTALIIGIITSGFVTFVVLAQEQVVVVPIFTTSTIELVGLEDSYHANATLKYSVKVSGYGSNCHRLVVSTIFPDTNDRVSFYDKADDCRDLAITHGPYNFVQQLEYGGPLVLNKSGTYVISVTFTDLIDQKTFSTSKSIFIS